MARFMRGVPVMLVVGLSATFLAAQPAREGDRPGADLPEFVISEVRLQEFPARTYLYTQEETTLADMGQMVPLMLGRVWDAVTDANVQIVGAPIFVYVGVTGEMDKPFQLQVGFPVADGTRVDGDLLVRQLENYRCATVLFSGPIAQIGQAYQKIFPEIQRAGLEPAGGSREMHLHWEGPESPNNVVLIQVGVK